ncbi:MAG: DUF1573 domain-containing protein [candidate division Zixibacteria bacterium]|nr:DUF1573 domain-containing protein [candidate division Zixibacteria bacterium]
MTLFLASVPVTIQAQSNDASSTERARIPRKGSYFGTLEIKPQPQWDFGYVPIDYRLVYKFILENTGDDTLQITKTESTCECTRAKARELISPGDTASLVITFDTKNFYGPQNRGVIVHSSDKLAPKQMATFRAVIGGHPEQADMRPRSVFFLPGQTVDTVKIRNYSEDDLNYSLVYYDSSLFSVTSADWSVDAQEYGEVIVTANERQSKGAYYACFTLEFDTDPPTRISTPVKIIRY